MSVLEASLGQNMVVASGPQVLVQAWGGALELSRASLFLGQYTSGHHEAVDSTQSTRNLALHSLWRHLDLPFWPVEIPWNS